MIMVDKITTSPLHKVGGVIGHAGEDVMTDVDAALAVFGS